ncbi:MAG: 50S ribosomal protein L6 [Thermoanaerobacterales bacterium]|nr:50S ribosomal protein L6 [Bacillota bacterium]MDI6906919.1 50S ribosomal protein L6 [Thermoanaerobacterales bacterium]
MSRIGKLPIKIPQGVSVAIDGNTVRVKGPKGELVRELPRAMTVVEEDGALIVKRPSDEIKDRALHGLTRSLLNNMVVGVTTGYAKALELVGVGYRAQKQGRKVQITIGYSHPVEYEPPADIELEVLAPTRIVVRGADKEKVGAVAAEIRKIRGPEPYKGKGIRHENEHIHRKAGKAGAKR